MNQRVFMSYLDAIWATIDPNAHAGSDIDTPTDLAVHTGDTSH